MFNYVMKVGTLLLSRTSCYCLQPDHHTLGKRNVRPWCKTQHHAQALP
jgi:hypothetical protein